MNRNVCFVLFVIFIVYTARDLFYKFHYPKSPDGSLHDIEGIKKEIPSMSFRSIQSGPTITVLYCHSCGYERAFEEYATIIVKNLLAINIVGRNYDPGFIRSKIAHLISVGKMIFIALLVTNLSPFPYIGIDTPQFWIWMREHKLYACLMIFFVSNTLESQLMSTGAFEIFYNDVPIWSKLTTGRIPSPTELIDIIKNQHKFTGRAMLSSGLDKPNDFVLHDH